MSELPRAPILVRALALAFMLTGLAGPARAQAPAPSPVPHDHEQMPVPAPAPDVAGQEHQHQMPAGQAMPVVTRQGSGTAWVPLDSPMYAAHRQQGAWQLMLMGNAFAQWLHESGRGGADQAGSINWTMGMATRAAGSGSLQLRGMVSLEPWTIRDCGYPNLLATGERCGTGEIYDRQHQHDLVMELAAVYDHPLTAKLRWHVYGGPVGEPALGPVAFPHRLSAFANPLAPISHHWLDSTHITFGVVTAGVSGARWRAEGSVFNGREPDEQRTNVELGALDSASARLSLFPSRAWAIQLSGGRLTDAEPGTGGESVGAKSLSRVTASATYHRLLADGGWWGTTLAWGVNVEPDHTSHALLAETTVTLRERDSWFGRVEVVGKSGHELAAGVGDELFTVAKVQAGYLRSLRARAGVIPGFGGSVSTGLVPKGLESAYGSRVNLGVGVFVALRPAPHRM